MSVDTRGAWLAQAYDPSTLKQTRRSLGDFSDIVESKRFEAARKAAEVWFEHLGRGGSLDVVTVKVACEQYVT
ncbi:MAG: integrase, partial [Burkholderiaceae bacterium]|nr:integrase [Burkholderiaceae bacterium]